MQVSLLQHVEIDILCSMSDCDRNQVDEAGYVKFSVYKNRFNF